MKVSSLYDVIGGYFRRRRARWFQREFKDCRTVVDLGGTMRSWRVWKQGPQSVLLVNIESPSVLPQPGFEYVQADACRTGLPDASFDLAFSNSVVEHVGDVEARRRFAQEMLRLGKRVYCQTPNKWFPVEPHYLALFVHWFPARWFTSAVHRYLTVNGMRGKAKENITLLTKKEFAALFPGCRIRTERVLGWPKSFVAWR